MLHTLANENNVLTFSEKGAELISWKFGDLELIWQAEPDIWPRHSPILFPFVGQLKNSCFIHHGKKYEMPRHGFVRDLIWTLKSKDQRHLCFELLWNEQTFKNYPFCFKIFSIYELEENHLRHQFEVINAGEELMYFGIGAHPAFITSGLEGEFVLIKGEKVNYKFNELRNGLISNKQNTTAGKIYLNENTFENDAWVFLNQGIRALQLFRKNPDFLIEVKGKKNPFWGIWSVPRCRKFVCLEPWWSHADFENQEADITFKNNIIPLESGERKNFEYNITVKKG